MNNTIPSKPLIRHEGHTPRKRSACGWRDGRVDEIFWGLVNRVSRCGLLSFPTL